jgi:hypothetical protein
LGAGQNGAGLTAWTCSKSLDCRRRASTFLRNGPLLHQYLRTNYGMTPEDYRSKWNLPRDYPMVAPAYAEQRRGLAKSIGLGRKKAPVAALSTIQPAIIATDAPKIPVKRGRPAKAKIAPAAAPKPKAPKKMKTDAPAA